MNVVMKGNIPCLIWKKLKLVAIKKGMQFKKSVLKKDLLTKTSDTLTVRATLSDNNAALQKKITEKNDYACVWEFIFRTQSC